MLVVKRFFPSSLSVFAINDAHKAACILYFTNSITSFRVRLPNYHCIRFEFVGDYLYARLTFLRETFLSDNLVAKTLCNTFLNRVYFQNYIGLKIIGIGYKFIVSKDVKYIFILAGLTHLLVHRLHYSSRVQTLKKKKRLIILNSTRSDLLLHECKFIRDLRPPDLYSGKGLRLFHELYKLKEGKKQIR